LYTVFTLCIYLDDADKFCTHSCNIAHFENIDLPVSHIEKFPWKFKPVERGGRGIGPLPVFKQITKPVWWIDSTVNWRLEGKRFKSQAELISCVIIKTIR
jgi:hypothetical protein